MALISKRDLQQQYGNRAAVDSDERTREVMRAQAELVRREDFAREIAALWRDAQDRFLRIGRYLIQAKTKLPHGEFEAMIASDLPFGRNVAHQLRSVVEAVDRARLGETELPRSYSVAYQLVTLTDRDLGLARQRGIVRPDVSRSEVLRFKEELRRQPAVQPHDRAALQRRRQSLLLQRDRIMAELAALDRLLDGAEIDGDATDVTT